MRSLQDLLAERRANVLEAARERDRIAKVMLEYHVADIDREIALRSSMSHCLNASRGCITWGFGGSKACACSCAVCIS